MKKKKTKKINKTNLYVLSFFLILFLVVASVIIIPKSLKEQEEKKKQEEILDEYKGKKIDEIQTEEKTRNEVNNFVNLVYNDNSSIEDIEKATNTDLVNYNIYYGPAQLANGWPHPGRMNPNLELADAYEYYSNPGQDGTIITSDDPDDATDYGGYDPAKNYRHFDKPYGIFEGKDARMWGTFILPGTKWKKTEIVIQAGTILPDGTPQILSGNPYTKDGQKYYVFGAQNKTDYSGFDTSGGNYTRTGFSFKKFLDERIETLYGYNKSLTDYIDMRYAEVLLNYAEAVVESGIAEDGCVAKATEALNATRHRAGHVTDVELTPENVQRERRVELAFENKRFWDLYRRREMHELHNNSMMHALLPVLDLRETPPSYIFIRSDIARVVKYTFLDYYYYHAIPGVSSNGMIQNPNY